jgi:predicted porin
MSQPRFRTPLLSAALLAALCTWPATTRAEGLDLRVYGFLNAQVEAAQAQGGATVYQRRGRVSDGNSRLGFAGAIPISEGFRGVWQLEGGLGNFEQGGVSDRGIFSTLESRNTFAGVEHDTFGRLIFGNNDSAYRSLIGSAGAFGGNVGLTKTGLDVWNNTSAQMSGNPDSVFSRGEARYQNSLHYDSPDLYGLRLGASYGFDEIATKNRLRERFCLAVSYEWGPLRVGVGYDRQANTGVDPAVLREGMPFSVGPQDGVSTSFYKGLVKYQNDDTVTSVAAGVEYASYGYSGYLPPVLGGTLKEGQMKQTAFMASVSQGVPLLPGLVVMAAYGQLFDLVKSQVGQDSDYGAWQYAVGAKYSVGDRFTAYVYWTAITNGSRQNVNFGQSPLFSNERGTSSAFLAPDNDPRALGFGLVTRF